MLVDIGHHFIGTADIKRFGEITYLTKKEFFVDRTFAIGGVLFPGEYVMSIEAEDIIKLFFQDDVLAGLIGKIKLIAIDLMVPVQLPEYGDEGGNAGASCNEITFAMVRDSAPHIAEYQLVTRHQFAELMGDAVVIVVGFYGKFQVGPFVEAGKGEWAAFFFPPVLVDGYLCSLTGFKPIALRLFDLIGAHVVCHVPDGQYLDNFFHSTIYEKSAGIGPVRKIAQFPHTANVCPSDNEPPVRSGGEIGPVRCRRYLPIGVGGGRENPIFDA